MLGITVGAAVAVVHGIRLLPLLRAVYRLSLVIAASHRLEKPKSKISTQKAGLSEVCSGSMWQSRHCTPLCTLLKRSNKNSKCMACVFISMEMKVISPLS